MAFPYTRTDHYSILSLTRLQYCIGMRGGGRTAVSALFHWNINKTQYMVLKTIPSGEWVEGVSMLAAV